MRVRERVCKRPFRLRLSLSIHDVAVDGNREDDLTQRLEAGKSRRVVLVVDLESRGTGFALPMGNDLKGTAFGRRTVLHLVLQDVKVVVSRVGCLIH